MKLMNAYPTLILLISYGLGISFLAKGWDILSVLANIAEVWKNVSGVDIDITITAPRTNSQIQEVIKAPTSCINIFFQRVLYDRCQPILTL